MSMFDCKHIESLVKFKRFKNTGERNTFLKTELSPILGDAIVDMMIFKGFCSAPASTKWHGNYDGGLFDHSLAVACCLQKYTEKMMLKWTKADSPIRIGMLHDLCKIDVYKKVIDKSETFDFEVLATNPEKFHYEWDNTPLVKGHGDKSVIYALNWGCPLTEEEIACITYHMGAYEKDRWDAYSNAIKQYHNVLYTHMADMEASKIMGV